MGGSQHGFLILIRADVNHRAVYGGWQDTDNPHTALFYIEDCVPLLRSKGDGRIRASSKAIAAIRRLTCMFFARREILP